MINRFNRVHEEHQIYEWHIKFEHDGRSPKQIL